MGEWQLADVINPAAHHLPSFVTAPGEGDWLMTVVVIFLLAAVLVVGNLYLRLHALPERMAHRANHVQLEVVAVLALLALFTHNNLFWVAALLLAMVRLPDFETPIVSIARSLERLTGRVGPAPVPVLEPEAEPQPAPETRRDAAPEAGV